MDLQMSVIFTKKKKNGFANVGHFVRPQYVAFCRIPGTAKVKYNGS